MDIMKKIRLLIRESINNQVEEERIPNPEADEYVRKKLNFLGSHTYGEDLGGLHKMYVAYSYGEQHPLFVWIDKEEFKKLRPYEAKDLNEAEDDGKKHTHLYSDEIQHDTKDDKNTSNDEKEIDLSKTKGPWFYNEKPYYVRDKKGRLKPNKWTYKHLKDLKPNDKTQARDTVYLQKLINDFKKKNRIGDNTHSDLEPGEK